MRGQHDLDVRGQHPTPARGIRGFIEYPSNRSGRDIDAALSEPQQGETWLWLSPELPDTTVGLLGLGELTP